MGGEVQNYICWFKIQSSITPLLSYVHSAHGCVIHITSKLELWGVHRWIHLHKDEILWSDTTVTGVWCQLVNSTNYWTVEYRKFSHEYWVVYVVSMRHLICSHCIAQSARQWHMLLILWRNRIGATVHINQQRKSSSFSRSSKSQKHPIVLPVCLSMVEALPAKSAIFLL